MQAVLYVLCTCLWAAGLILFFLLGSSAVIQIIGCLLGISGTLMFVGAAIMGSIEEVRDAIKGAKQ